MYDVPVSAPRPPTGHERLHRARIEAIEAVGVTRIRLRGTSPLMTLASTIAFGALVGGFGYPVASMLSSPRPVPLSFVAFAGVAVLTLGVVLAVRRHILIDEGWEDLVIDDHRRTISLPRNLGRSRETIVRFDRIIEIAPAEEVRTRLPGLYATTTGPRRYRTLDVSPNDDAPGRGQRGEERYAVVIRWRDDRGDEVISPVARWVDLHRTRSLALWLRDRLGTPPGGESPAGPEPGPPRPRPRDPL